MNSKNSTTLNRRGLLKSAAALAASSGFAGQALFQSAQAAPNDRRFLFVIGANGGASIIDSFLPVLDSDSTTGINTYTEAELQQVNGSNFICPKPRNNLIQGAVPLGDRYDMGNFLRKHSQDMVVVTQQGSSVNHQIASRRSVDGNGINNGRTLQEAVATQYGQDLLLPNANMGSADFGGTGRDPNTPIGSRPEVVADPRYLAFATHGYKGIKGAPQAELIHKARALRMDIDQVSEEHKAFNAHEQVKAYLHNRDNLMPQLEDANLINQLLLLNRTPDDGPLSEYNLEASDEAQTLLSHFPNMYSDPFEAQTAMAFLLIKSGVSCTATIEPSDSPYLKPGAGALTSPLAFDWSHLDHRSAQNAMWGRVMNMTDQLISLLKATEYQNGASYWDHSLVYIATEFGREKVSEGGSGHDQNNGNVILSPYLKGNRVYGGVNANTARTYGFDPQTGDEMPNVTMNEGDIYSAICHAMGIEFEGRRDMPCMVKA